MRGRLLATALVLAAVGCATPRLAPVPLRPEPVAFADTLRIPEPPEQKEGRVVRALLVHAPLQLSEPVDPGEGEALDVTHEDDVVSSAWWERRMGYEGITPEQLAWGPTSAQGAPAASGPLTVKSVKAEGVTPGFTMKDANGNTYIVKFDPVDSPHIQSASGVIGNRLMWGAGFWVPEDYLTVIDPARLTVDPKATIATENGKRPLTLDDVKKLLTRADPADDGTGYVALASRFVPGTPKGPFFFSGRRKDDPNDHYDHEQRRELRALRVFSAWINDNDRREGNTLDVYVKPGYLRHYMIDFAASLGSSSTRPKQPYEDERPLDPYTLAARVFSLGLYHEDWEGKADQRPDSILGFLRGADFKPGDWKAWWTNPAFQDMTHADAYWGAKIVSTYTDAHVRAAVSAGGLPTRQLQDTLASLIEIRRDILVRWAFEKVSTVEEPVVARQAPGTLRLSFRDLGLEKRLWTASGTTYDWTFSDPARGRSGKGSAQPRAGGDQLLDVSWEGPAAAATVDANELARLSIVTRRPDLAPDPATIFLRWTSTGYQVVGLTHGNPDY